MLLRYILWNCCLCYAVIVLIHTCGKSSNFYIIFKPSGVDQKWEREKKWAWVELLYILPTARTAGLCLWNYGTSCKFLYGGYIVFPLLLQILFAATSLCLWNYGTSCKFLDLEYAVFLKLLHILPSVRTASFCLWNYGTSCKFLYRGYYTVFLLLLEIINTSV